MTGAAVVRRESRSLAALVMTVQESGTVAALMMTAVGEGRARRQAQGKAAL